MHGNVVVNQCEITGLPRDVEGDFIGESASGGFGDCNFPHPTSTTAAIVISSCFIWRSSGGGVELVRAYVIVLEKSWFRVHEF